MKKQYLALAAVLSLITLAYPLEARAGYVVGGVKKGVKETGKGVKKGCDYTVGGVKKGCYYTVGGTKKGVKETKKFFKKVF